MKYIITSKNEFLGTSYNDNADPLTVTEICSELIITRLHVIDLLNTNQINDECCIVTVKERKCLYDNIFKNVITYDEFKNLTHNNTLDIYDLLTQNTYHYLSQGGGIPYFPFYQNFERDKDKIFNINKSDLTDYNLSKPFVVLVIRKRGAWPEKNLVEQFWYELINLLSTNNISVLVFGKECENFCDGVNVQYIKNFQDWCSIVQHNNIRHVFSTMTGGVYPLLIFGNSNTEMTIVDNTQLMSLHGGDPSFYSDCINFSKIKIDFINKIPTIEESYEYISKSF
jgi:hypothetical protein